MDLMRIDQIRRKLSTLLSKPEGQLGIGCPRIIPAGDDFHIPSGFRELFADMD
jgi:hypothetical protein